MTLHGVSKLYHQGHGIFGGVIGSTIYLPGGATRQGIGATNLNSAFRVSP